MDWLDHDGSVSAVFDADDQRKLDMLESARRAGQSGSVSKRTRAYAVGCLATPFFLLGGCLTTIDHPHGAKFAGFAIIVVSLAIVGGLQRAGDAPVRPPSSDVRSTFTLRITRDVLTLSTDAVVIAEVALAELADVVGGTYVELVRRDGARVRLAHVLPASTNEVMAAEINARVREMRSLGGYRG
jgi:hypothetical protein